MRMLTLTVSFALITFGVFLARHALVMYDLFKVGLVEWLWGAGISLTTGLAIGGVDYLFRKLNGHSRS